MWIILQILGCALIAGCHIINRERGLDWYSYTIYIAMNVFFTGWMFPISYNKAPSFFQAYFIGLVFLAIVGFLISVFYFKESLLWYNYAAAVGAIVCAFLLVK